MTHADELNQKSIEQCWFQAKSGDRSALAELLTKVQDSIFRFCLAQLQDRELAAEATQETATRLVVKIGRFTGQCRLMTWIFGIAINVCRELRRKQNRFPTAELVEEPIVEGMSSDALEKSESIEQLRRQVGQLPPRQREAIVLRFFEALPLKEVAVAMDISVGTVKATINQAINNLKVQLPNYQ